MTKRSKVSTRIVYISFDYSTTCVYSCPPVCMHRYCWLIYLTTPVITIEEEKEKPASNVIPEDVLQIAASWGSHGPFATRDTQYNTISLFAPSIRNPVLIRPSIPEYAAYEQKKVVSRHCDPQVSWRGTQLRVERIFIFSWPCTLHTCILCSEPPISRGGRRVPIMKSSYSRGARGNSRTCTLVHGWTMKAFVPWRCLSGHGYGSREARKV